MTMISTAVAGWHQEVDVCVNSGDANPNMCISWFEVIVVHMWAMRADLEGVSDTCRRFGAWTPVADCSWSTAQLVSDHFPMRKIANVPNHSFIPQSHQTIEPLARRLGDGRFVISQTWHKSELCSGRSHQRHFKKCMRRRSSNSAIFRKLRGMSVEMHLCFLKKLWCHQANFQLDAWLSRWHRPRGRFGSVQFHICVIKYWKIIKQGLFPCSNFSCTFNHFSTQQLKTRSWDWSGPRQSDNPS